MEITDFAKGSYWMIDPKYLDRMIQRMPSSPETISDLKVNFTPEPQERDDFMLQDGVGIIPVVGPLSKRDSLWSFFFGGSSYARLTEVFNAALEDPDVEAILLDIDSPGGTVNGTEAFGERVYSARKIKPVAAFGSGMMTSAAYWIGSAAQRIMVEKTTDVGSIGVVMVHMDWSEEDKMIGLKRTVLYAGKYKALGNDAEPLTDLARQTFQAELDYLYSLFVDAVARNRGADSETVTADMADGRIFIGQQAMDAGLVDRIGTREAAMEMAREMIPGPAKSYFYYQLSKEQKAMTDKKIEVPTTIEGLFAICPDLCEQIEQRGADSVDREALRMEGAGVEKERILGLAAIQFGEAAGETFRKVVETGVTVDQFKAIDGARPAGSGSEKNEEMLEAIHQAGAEDPGPDHQVQNGSKPFLAQVEEYVALHKCSRTDAMLAVMKKDPAAHEEYIKSVN